MTDTDIPPVFPFTEFHELENDPRLAAARSSGPLCRVRLPYGGPAWLATSHEHVRRVLSDQRLSRSAATGPDTPRQMASSPGTSTILDLDPPEHARLRTLVSKAFSNRTVATLERDIQAVVDALLNDLAGTPANESVELVDAFALALPMNVICGLLGVPYADRGRFRAWTEGLVAIRALTAEQIAEVVSGLDEYLTGLLNERRTHPRDDLLSALVTARDDDDRLTEDEMISFGVQLLVAGYETTASMLASSVYFLLTRPEHLDWFRTHPEQVHRMVEELLRFIPLSGGSGLPRVAETDLSFGDMKVCSGEAIFVSTVAANRDDIVFDRPDEFNPGREPNPHLTFGYGPHHCLGSQLVRTELRIALTSMFDRFPGLRLAVPRDQIPWKRGAVVRGPQALPVTW